MAQLFDPHFQAVNASGLPLSGAKLFFYQALTTTLITVYQDADETTPHANPVIADASGLFPPIFVPSALYKFVLQTSAGVIVQTVDEVLSQGVPGWVTPRDFVADAGTGGDDTAAVQAAMAVDAPMFIDRVYRTEAAAVHNGTSSKLVFGSGNATSQIILTNATQDGLVAIGGGPVTVRDIGFTTTVNKTAGAVIRSTSGGMDSVEHCQFSGPNAATMLYDGVVINSVIPNISKNYFLSCSNVAVTVFHDQYAGAGCEASIVGNTFNTAEPAPNASTAIMWSGGNGPININDNRFQNYDYALSVFLPSSVTTSQLVFRGNMVTNTNQVALNLNLPDGSTAVLVDALIADNIFYLQNAGRCINAAKAGAGSDQWIQDINIVGNKFYFNDVRTVNLECGVNALIASNMWRGNADVVPIYVAATRPSFGIIDSKSNMKSNVSTLYDLNGNPGWVVT